MLKTALLFISLSVVFSSAHAEDAGSYFKKTYQEARQDFLDNAAQLKKQVPNLELKEVVIPSNQENDLHMDCLYIPPASGKKDRLLILTSGVHGIEGFVGSALQNMFVKENFWKLRDENLGILLVHAMNPYGFRFERRVTEHNVDLNRNFDVNTDLFKLQNEGYREVSPLLNPSEPATSGWWDRTRFYIQAVIAILQHSMESLRRAVLKGQYEFSKGIYFGGSNFEPQKDLLENEILSRAEGYQQVLLIDLHTGYGERGHLHLFADRSPVIDADYLAKIFKGHDLDYGQKKDFYEVTGGFVVFAGKLLQGKTKYAGMVFEFGTLNSQKTMGSLDSIYRMVRENELTQHGSASDKDRDVIRLLFREMFYPSSAKWRSSVVQQFHSVLGDALKNQQNP